MSELSKQALKVENSTQFPNNNDGLITPSNLRAFNEDIIDSLVDEIKYNEDSGSWNTSIDALNQFTSSQQPSFTALNAFTASQLTINSGYNSATQSLQGQITSLVSEVDSLQTWTGSVNEISDDGILQGYSTRLHFYGNVSASIVPNVGGPIASISIPFSSTDTGSLLITASFDNGTRDLTFTKGDSSQFSVNIPDASGSVLPPGVVSGSAQLTGSFVTLDTTQTISGTKIFAPSPDGSNGISMQNATRIRFGAVGTNRISSPDSNTLTIETVNNSPVSGSPNLINIISGINGQTGGNGSKINIETRGAQQDTQILISSSLVNITGMTGVSGSLNVSGSLSAYLQEGYVWVGDGSGRSTTVSTGSFSSIYSQNTIVYGKNVHSTSIAKGTPLYFTGSGTSGNLVGILPADAGNPSLMPAGGVAGETIDVGAEGLVFLDGFINNVDTSLFQPGDEVFVAVGGGYTNTPPTGSTNLVQKLGNVEKSAVNGSGVINGPGAVRSVPNIQEGYTWVGDGDGVAQALPTSSFGTPINTGSFATTGSNTFFGNQDVNGEVRILNVESGDDAFSVQQANGLQGYLNIGPTGGNSGNMGIYATGSDIPSGRQDFWGINRFGSGWQQSFQTPVVFSDGATFREGVLLSWQGGTTAADARIGTNHVSESVQVYTGLSSDGHYIVSSSVDERIIDVNPTTATVSISNTISSQIFLNPQILTGTQTVPNGFNGMLTGPVSNGGTIVVESGSTLVII